MALQNISDKLTDCGKFTPVAKVGQAKKPGRKGKKTPEIVAVILEALHHALPVQSACDYAGIHKDQFYRWKKRDHFFAAAVRFARAEAEKKLVAAVSAKDPWKILKNHNPEAWKDDVTLQVKALQTMELSTPSGKKYLSPF